MAAIGTERTCQRDLIVAAIMAGLLALSISHFDPDRTSGDLARHAVSVRLDRRARYQPKTGRPSALTCDFSAIS